MSITWAPSTGFTLNSMGRTCSTMTPAIRASMHRKHRSSSTYTNPCLNTSYSHVCHYVIIVSIQASSPLGGITRVLLTSSNEPGNSFRPRRCKQLHFPWTLCFCQILAHSWCRTQFLRLQRWIHDYCLWWKWSLPQAKGCSERGRPRHQEMLRLSFLRTSIGWAEISKLVVLPTGMVRSREIQI